MPRKSAKRYEDLVRSYSNHYRIKILFLLSGKPNTSLEDIAALVGGNYRTIGIHAKRLERGGMVHIKRRGAQTLYRLSKRGKYIVETLENLP